MPILRRSLVLPRLVQTANRARPTLGSVPLAAALRARPARLARLEYCTDDPRAAAAGRGLPVGGAPAFLAPPERPGLAQLRVLAPPARCTLASDARARVRSFGDARRRFAPNTFGAPARFASLRELRAARNRDLVLRDTATELETNARLVSPPPHRLYRTAALSSAPRCALPPEATTGTYTWLDGASFTFELPADGTLIDLPALRASLRGTLLRNGHALRNRATGALWLPFDCAYNFERSAVEFQWFPLPAGAASAAQYAAVSATASAPAAWTVAPLVVWHLPAALAPLLGWSAAAAAALPSAAALWTPARDALLELAPGRCPPIRQFAELTMRANRNRAFAPEDYAVDGAAVVWRRGARALARNPLSRLRPVTADYLPLDAGAALQAARRAVCARSCLPAVN